MPFDRLITFFLPPAMRNNKTHPRYGEFRVIISSSLLAIPLMFLFPVFLFLMRKPFLGYFINDALIIITLFCIRFFAHYRLPMTVTAIATYAIIYDWIAGSGLIYSPNMSILHIYLLAAIWVDKKYGWWAIFGNLAVFGLIYYQTLHAGLPGVVHSTLGGPLYALGMNCLITIFFGGFLAYQQFDQERDRVQIRNLQDHKISLLDEAVKKRTEQLNTMRETMATDFHDETGNMLSAITRQASLLKFKLDEDNEARPVVESIIRNSNALYASSKDFLWHLNHDSDDPNELFDYLTGYGQRYYNQFDIAFSSAAEECHLLQFEPSAALNVIFIFKEAMTNVTKHADATEVELAMACEPEFITYTLHDNGTWKDMNTAAAHYGLANMERRCKKNNFKFTLTQRANGTSIGISVPFSRADII
jgi:signal transduction histidine kinase